MREIQQGASEVSTGIFTEDEAKTFRCGDGWCLCRSKATAKKLADQNLGRVLIGDATPTQRLILTLTTKEQNNGIAINTVATAGNIGKGGLANSKAITYMNERRNRISSRTFLSRYLKKV